MIGCRTIYRYHNKTQRLGKQREMKEEESKKIKGFAMVLQCLSDAFVHCLIEASIQILSALFVV